MSLTYLICHANNNNNSAFFFTKYYGKLSFKKGSIFAFFLLKVNIYLLKKKI